MIRILHSVSNMDRGGIETMLMNFYRHVDRTEVQFDFIQNKPDAGDYDEEIRSLGGRIFVSPGFKSYGNYLKFMRDLTAKYPEYKIIHTHNGPLMLYALKSAKKIGIPVRIAHAHSTAVPPGPISALKKVMRPMIKYAATERWGCSNAAGEFYFSKKYWDAGHELIRNAIEPDNFKFDAAARTAIREQYGLGDKFILGHVGRLTAMKNQSMILDVFAELHKLDPQTHLLMVGTGELEKPLKAHTAELGITDSVTFTGVQTNVNEWYSVFDVFIMTSVNEGLPVVAVEAQAADLPCVLSDAITAEVRVTDNVKFMSLSETPTAWAKTILGFKDAKERVSRAEDLIKSGYEITTEAQRMQELYLKLYSRIKEK